MKVECSFVQLHSGDSMFFAGKNFGTKLDTKKDVGLILTFDEDANRLIVQYSGKMTKLPHTSVFHYTPIEGNPKEEAPVTHKSHPQTKKIASAQVSTPTGHVFNGPGAGRTN